MRAGSINTVRAVVEPTANEPASVPLNEQAANSAFKFVNGFDATPIPEEAPGKNMPIREKAAIKAFEFVNGLDDTPTQLKEVYATERDDSLSKDMPIRKGPVLINA